MPTKITIISIPHSDITSSTKFLIFNQNSGIFILTSIQVFLSAVHCLLFTNPMAHTKAGGTAKNLRDSNPKYLGIKRADGQKVTIGEIIVRQRGTKILPGKNIGVGSDYTLFARIAGTVHFRNKRKTNFDRRVTHRSIVDVV